MKKITAVFVLLLILVSLLSASTVLAFSGSGTVVGANGRTIRKTEVEINDKGLIVIAENEKVTAEGEGIRVIIGEGTIAALTDDGSVFTLYVVKGEAAVSTSSPRNLKIYTPTTLTLAEECGDYYVLSTDTEEYFYNHSSSEVKTYDAIRGTETVIASEAEYDIVKKSTITKENDSQEAEPSAGISSPDVTTAENVKAPEEPLSSEIEITPVVPDKPVMTEAERNLGAPREPVITEAERSLEIPQKPVITKAERNLTTPDEPVLKRVDATLTEETENIRVTRTLVDIDDEKSL